MSLTVCPECAHEVSIAATACPNCGHPFARQPVQPVQPRVVVQEFIEEESSFPKWAFIPIGLLAAVLLFTLFVFLRNGDDEQGNVNLRIASQPTTGTSTRDTAVRTETPSTQTVVPSTSQPSQISVPPPSTSTATVPSSTTSVPSTQTVVPDKGTVSLEAKISNRNGGTQPVRNVKFYLLKKDVDSILSDADIENETGQAMLTALGMSVVSPAEYGDFGRKAFAAIGKETAYNVTTDGGGKAQLKDIKPDSYYLFAVAKTGNGYTLWNSPVTIQAGQNSLILPPATPTEIVEQ